ncbi:MAG: hypothetical protein IJS15_04465, partial [Victivallales bacterium]|nr:hypothetical protein [Victivallales bacterium]
YLSNGLVWHSVETTPSLLDDKEGMVGSEFMFICRRDIRTAVSWSMKYQDKGGALFPVKFSFSADESMLWRMGQIILLRKNYKPYFEAMKATRRIITPGDVMMSANLTSIPNTLFKAFEFNDLKNNVDAR